MGANLAFLQFFFVGCIFRVMPRPTKKPRTLSRKGAVAETFIGMGRTVCRHCGSEIVFAARDPKFGACGSLAMLPRDRRLNHRCQVDGGLMADQSGELLRRFFQRLR